MEKACASLIQFLFSTNSACMIAIYPVGPPKLSEAELTQWTTAGTITKVTARTRFD
jgi:hypothetical protein